MKSLFKNWLLTNPLKYLNKLIYFSSGDKKIPIEKFKLLYPAKISRFSISRYFS